MLFENEPDHRLFLLIFGIWEKSRRWNEQQLKMLNMTFPQFSTLTALSRKDGVTQRELADMVETDTTTIMVLCDSLEKKGWLKRMPDPNDRRVNRLILTDSGRNIYSKAYPLVRSGYEHILKGIGIKEFKKVIPTLEKLYQNTNELLNQNVK
jgi:MarR family transcriptional regulator for hemolysin